MNSKSIFILLTKRFSHSNPYEGLKSWQRLFLLSPKNLNLVKITKILAVLISAQLIRIIVQAINRFNSFAGIKKERHLV